MAEIISIESPLLSAEISANGAELKSLRRIGLENSIWQVDEAFWNRSAPILFPIVGKLKNNRYSWKGEQYEMLQHGFARNQNFKIHAFDTSSAVFRLQQNSETLEQYPFDFILDVTYMLMDSRLITTYSVTNCGKASLPFSIGGHPGFQLTEALENYTLLFPHAFDAYRFEIQDGLYTGGKETMHVEQNFKLNNEYFQKDAIVFKQPQFNEVHLCKSDKSIVAVRCHDWNAVGFWTKPGAPFFCIEPWWGWADSIQSNGFLEDKDGLIWLAPNENRSFTFEIEVFDATT
jgi:galactose mutarotase-like enzyme